MILFALALAVRIAFLWWRGPLLFVDTADYLQIAENLRAHGAFSLSPGEPFVPTIYRPPLYPALLALPGDLAERAPAFIAAAQALLDAGVCVFVHRLARTFAPPAIAFGAGLAYALHPGAIVAASSLLTETLYTFLSVLGVWLLVHGLGRDRLRLSTLAGLSLGLAALTRSIGAAVPVLFALVILGRRWTPRPRAHAAVVVLAAAAVMTPWIVRSSVAARSFVLIQGPSSAMNFYIPTRTDWDQRDEERIWAVFFTDDGCGRSVLMAANPAEMADANRVCAQAALANIRRAPLDYVWSRLRALPHLVFTSFDSFTGIDRSFAAAAGARRYGRLAVKLALLLLFSALPFFLAIAGLKGAPAHAAAGLAAAAWMFTLLIHLPMWIEYRFWQPAVPFLMVSAALGMRAANLRAQRVSRGSGI